ncbi:MAG: hypothetical protein HOP15_09760 [Planctomycetes bacterium]|nr:hypothetical protein [Planctomycetota bacterium]
MTPDPGRRWFPFSIPEVEVTLAIYALSTSTLAFLGVEKRPLAWFTLGYLAFAYLAGLLVHARRPGFTLLRDGALRGAGYARFFRGATRSLLLLHTDDDSPSDELLGLYRTLLDRGIELRRIIFIRPDHAPGAYDWVHRFGRHERLQQRVILPDRADVMRLSFVVVDERWSMLSVPGDAAVDGEGYAGRYVLRHLLAIEDAEIAEAFTEVHRQLWRRATVVDEALFAGLPQLPKPDDE